MNKQEFLAQLRKGLSGLPQDDVEERLTFYGEMIEDRMEEGLTQEEAVDQIGSVREIVSQLVAQIPLTKLVKEKVKSKRILKAWEVILLVLGSPVWLSLLLAALAVILSLYISLWCVMVSLWAVFGSVVGCAIGGTIAGVAFVLTGNGLMGWAVLGMGVACLGLSIFLFFGCKWATKGILIFTKQLVIWIKNRLMKKEEA